MPTKRRKLGHHRINAPVPQWVRQLKAGEPPEVDSEADQEMVGWYFFGDEVGGLPPADSDVGRALWKLRHAD